MKKILFLIKAREFGGLEIVLLDWLSQIDYSKAEVIVCCYGTDALISRLTRSGPAIRCVKLTIPEGEPFWSSLPKWLRLFASIRPCKIVILEAILSEFNLTPVLAAWWSSHGGLFLFEANWGRSMSRASSMTKRRLHYGFLPGLGLYRYKELITQRLRGRLARHTFVVSQGIKNNLIADFGYPAEKTSILYHGVDTERFQPSPTDRLEFRRGHGIPDSATVIVSHGRLVRRKRVDRILKAFDILVAEHQGLWLMLTAYGPLREDLESAVAKSKASGRIKLVDFQDDASLILKASDIYVLASDDEGFGIALVEALATGLVCVATRGPGPCDIINNRENGVLVDATEEGVLAGLRQGLTLTPYERDRMSQRARATVINRFEIDAAILAALDAIEVPHR
jgi:glycosyltransferase involved in cell wall biosynthesis